MISFGKNILSSLCRCSFHRSVCLCSPRTPPPASPTASGCSPWPPATDPAVKSKHCNSESNAFAETAQQTGDKVIRDGTGKNEGGSLQGGAAFGGFRVFPTGQKSSSVNRIDPASRFSKTPAIPWICSQRHHAEYETNRRRVKVERVVSVLQFKWILPENRTEMNSTLNHYF